MYIAINWSNRRANRHNNIESFKKYQLSFGRWKRRRCWADRLSRWWSGGKCLVHRFLCPLVEWEIANQLDREIEIRGLMKCIYFREEYVWTGFYGYGRRVQFFVFVFVSAFSRNEAGLRKYPWTIHFFSRFFPVLECSTGLLISYYYN